jgi:hypothetical protein
MAEEEMEHALSLSLSLSQVWNVVAQIDPNMRKVKALFIFCILNSTPRTLGTRNPGQIKL